MERSRLSLLWPLLGVLALGLGLVAVALVIDVQAALEYGATWPLRFSVLVVLTVPPQIWAGAALGLRVRHRRTRSTPADAEAASV